MIESRAGRTCPLDSQVATYGERAMAELTITLTETLKTFIEDRVAQGDFADSTDYLKALVEADRSAWNLNVDATSEWVKQNLGQIENLIREGVESGDPIAMDSEYFERMRKRMRIEDVANSSTMS